MLTPLQKRRQKFVNRNRDKALGLRQDETLAKLKAFSSSIRTKKDRNSALAAEVTAGYDGAPIHVDGNSRAAGAAEHGPVATVSASEAEAYHGQVTESDMLGNDSDDDGANWFRGKLRFKKVRMIILVCRAAA